MPSSTNFCGFLKCEKQNDSGKNEIRQIEMGGYGMQNGVKKPKS